MSTNNTVATQDTSTVHTVTAVAAANKAGVPFENNKKKNNSEQEASSSNVFCRRYYCFQPCRQTLLSMTIKFVVGLTLTIVAGVGEAFLAISIFLRSTHLKGTSGAYGAAIPAIGMILLTMFIVYTLYLFLSYRWQKKVQQRRPITSGGGDNDDTHDGDDHDEEEDHDHDDDVDDEDDEEQGHVYKEEVDKEVPSSEATRHDTFPSWGAFAGRRLRRLWLRVLLPLSFILLAGTEVALVLNIPRNALFPLVPPFAQDALLDDAAYRPSTCDLANRWANAKHFFVNNTALDFGKVKLVYGGMTFSTNALASEYDNTIYFWKNS